MVKIASLEDVDEIYNLNTELFIFLNELKSEIYNPIAFPRIFIESMINSLNSDYIIIEEDDKIIGYALIEERVSPYKDYEAFVEDHYAFIYELVVLPEYRTKGYGRKLIEEAKKWAENRKLTSIELNVLENNMEFVLIGVSVVALVLLIFWIITIVNLVQIKKLKKNRKYYVRIRTYKMINGKKYTSAWSKAKTVVVK